MGWTEVILPIGISFFTFQKISYLLDVYRGVKKPLQQFSDHLLYVVLFPQLIAGPIVRYNDIADELTYRKDNLTIDNRISGLFRFAIGLAKKVLIANVVGEAADRIFDLPHDQLSSYQAWYGALCYTFQIYFDFSGYSDMAIGMGKMMGFRFPENFNSPYISKSITEFWRRWHITLSTWMRDYLYIPMGGNRVSTGRLYVNLWLVFLISGLWHGANWTFVIWGAYHGFFLVAERLFLKKAYSYLPAFFQMGITFFWVMLGWVFFRSQSLDQAWGFLTTMFSFAGQMPDIEIEVWSTLVVAVLFSFAAVSKKVEGWQEAAYFKRPFSSLVYLAVTAFLILTSLGSITASGFNPFIYFRF